MRIFLILLCLLLPVRQSFAQIESLGEEQEHRSRIAFDIFRKACFLNSTNRAKTIEFLDQNYKRVDANGTKKVIEFLKAGEGDVWKVVTPKSTFTVLSEINGNCHVMSQNLDASTIHKEMKNLALDVKDSLTFSVIDYKGVTPNIQPHISRFEVKAPDGSVFFSVRAVTKENSETKAAEGVVSIFSPAVQQETGAVRR